MNAILRKAMLPAAVAVAMVGFIGAFGGSTPTVEAVEGDICYAITDAFHELEDGQGNDVLVVSPEVTHGLVFRVEESVGENVEVRIDSETGSARITSKAELVSEDNVAHILVSPPVGTQVVDTIDPDDFDDADGNDLDSISAWLDDVGYGWLAGEVDDDDDLCTAGDDDGWGFIDFECIEAGFFHIDILTPDDTEETGMTLKFFCASQPDAATIAASPTTVEIVPVGDSKGSSTITVTVTDQFGDRIEHAEVTFTTDNCKFDADDEISPAGGGTTVTTYTDTDSSSDTNFLLNNPLEFSAGTAEAVLNCTTSAANEGVANITAIVQREGSDIVLKTTVTVVGQTAPTGLTLTLTPDDLECGETILATVSAVDSEGQPVSDGTTIYFTTDTSSGILGGDNVNDGAVWTVDGEASVLIATDPGNPGTHTVIAYTVNAAGSVSAQTSETYVCDGAVAPVAPTAPTVNPPNNGTGTGTITPPNTGDAGLAGSSSSSLFVIVGAVAFVLAGLASVRFARN